MAEYSLTAESLLAFGRNPPQSERAFARWAAFADKVGQAIFPFIIRPDCLNAVPFRALGMTPVKLSDMVPQPGEMWVLFCFKDSFREAVSPDSPLRTDGFPLVLEWRRGQPDSDLLSSAFHDLAARVREQFGEDGKGWGLHPAFDRYGDTIAFTDPELFSDAENSLQIASAWGALAAGLHCCITNKYYGVWPFPSVQWDWIHNRAVGVAGIAEKLSVAADCGATVVTVAGDQKRETQELISNLKKSKDDGRYGRLSVLAVLNIDNPRVLARKICDDAIKRVRFRRLIFSVVVFLVCLMAAFGLFIFDASRTVKCYYADYVDSFGLPQGIFQLKESELEHRHIHYRFEFDGFQRGRSPHADSADWCIWNWFGFRRRLARVVQANSHGYPCKWNHTAYSDRPQIQDFKYDRDLRLREIRYGRYNGEGREPYLEKRIELSNARGEVNGLMEFFVNNERLDLAFGMASATTVSLTEILESPKIEITKHLCQRDGQGRIKRRLFLNNSNANVKDADGLFGFSYEHDGMGRTTLIWYLGRKGEEYCPRANKQGVAGKQYAYIGHNISREEYVDESGSPILRLRGWGACESSFDNYDRIIKIRFLGIDGGEVHREYDFRGNKIREVYYGTDGKLAPGSDGCAEIHWEYDERGNITKMSFYGVDGQLTLTNSGFAAVRMDYDENGNRTKQLYFGVDGMPVLHKDGCSEVHWEYDMYGNKTGEAYFGVDGKPKLHKNGYAEVRMEYDERGNKTRRVFVDTNGMPTLNKDGFAEVRMKYDEYGNATNEALFGVDGKPALDRVLGYAEMRMKYDGRGNMTKVSFFGVNGKPTLASGGFAEKHFEYDEHGNVTTEQCFGVEGKPILCKDGYAEIHITYDNFGNVTKRIELGVDGKPMRNTGYDEHGRKTKETLFGIGGGPTQGFEYDERGNMTKISFFGADGEPIICNEIGCAELRTEYDERGNVTKSFFFGVDGMPTLGNEGFAEKRVKYDIRGNITTVSFFGVKGEPVLCKYDYAELRLEYDERGKVTKMSYFDADGKPTLHKDGYAMIRYTYKPDGAISNTEYSDVSGKVIVLHQVIMSVEVIVNSMAAKLGIREGDIWCRLGTYDIVKMGDGCDIKKAVQTCRDMEKVLVVARKVGNSYEIHSFRFPVGIMGIVFGNRNITDFDKLEQAYKVYCEEESTNEDSGGES